MNHPDEPGRIFQAPTSPHVEEHAQPPVDGSDEARRRLRHPFDVSVPTGPGSTTRPEPEEQSGNPNGEGQSADRH